MEYRLFYPIDESTLNAKWQTKSNYDSRKDIYFILPTVLNDHSDEFHIDNGLKLRNRKTLELKTCEKRYSNGQEYWLKTIHSNKTVNIDDMDSIVKMLRKSNENKLIERLQSSKPIIICHVNKYCQKKYLLSNIIEELSGLHLKYVRYDDQSQIGNDLYFETVCIEQSNSILIDEKIIEKLSQKYSPMVMNAMGYPEFLYRQYQQIVNP